VHLDRRLDRRSERLGRAGGRLVRRALQVGVPLGCLGGRYVGGRYVGGRYVGGRYVGGRYVGGRYVGGRYMGEPLGRRAAVASCASLSARTIMRSSSVKMYEHTHSCTALLFCGSLGLGRLCRRLCLGLRRRSWQERRVERIDHRRCRGQRPIAE
jgi:hypothetical protein